MADHRIEQLVEDSLALVISAQRSPAAKRGLVAELLDFRTRFDAADTSDRLAAELRSIDYFAHVPAAPRPIVETIADVMADADAAGDRRMVHHWLAVLAIGIEDGTLVDDELPYDFAAFDRAPSVDRIRGIAVRHRVGRFRGGPDGYVTMPSWSWWNRLYRASDPRTLDMRGMLRLLLDHEADREAIVAEIVLHRTRQDELDGVVDRLPAMVETRGPFRYVGGSRDARVRTFVFAWQPPHGTPAGVRFYLVLDHDGEHRILSMSAGARSDDILRLQGPHARGEEAMHFRTNIATLAPRASIEGDRNFVRDGWRFRIGQSEGVLSKRLDAMLRLSGYADAFFEFHARPVAERVDAEGFEGMARKRRERMTLGFFANEVDMLFACACRRWERGDRPRTEIAAIREWLEHIAPAVGDGRRDRVDCLAALAAGPAFPPVARLPFRRHEERWPLADDGRDDTP